MRLALLVLALLAAILIGNQETHAQDEAYEDPVADEEPEQSEDVGEAAEATADEPISDADASDDVAAQDEPSDASEDDEAFSFEESEEPEAELEPWEEPIVWEEVLEGEEGEEELESADDGVTLEDGSTFMKRWVREKRAAATTKKPATTTKKPVVTTKPTTKKPVTTTTKRPIPANMPPPRPSPSVKYDDPIRCTGAQMKGPCWKSIRRWHYNPVSNTCNEFQYSGCGGNDNNWVFRGNCVNVCVKKEKPPPPKEPPMKWDDKRRCQGPIVKGTCKRAIKRFHYNSATDKCEEFTWTGCDETPNNWVYIANCQKICVTKKTPPKVKWDDKRRCEGPQVRGTCGKNIRRYHYNAAKDKCEAFSFSGCGANLNNWQYVKNCQKVCVKDKPKPPEKIKWDDKRRCEGPVEKGPCNKKLRRFHYSAARDQCLPFEYSGCGGNHNNWWHKSNCQKICLRKKLKWNDPHRCEGPVVRGPCKKNIRRYHYNAELNRCEPFSYGGCSANDNNWWYKGNCDKICVKDTPTPAPPRPNWDDPVRCRGPPAPGTCTRKEPRFYYNPLSNTCEPFLYSGCGGNDNNWWYHGNCRNICVRSDDDVPDGGSGGGTSASGGDGGGTSVSGGDGGSTSVAGGDGGGTSVSGGDGGGTSVAGGDGVGTSVAGGDGGGTSVAGGDGGGTSVAGGDGGGISVAGGDGGGISVAGGDGGGGGSDGGGGTGEGGWGFIGGGSDGGGFIGTSWNGYDFGTGGGGYYGYFSGGGYNIYSNVIYDSGLIFIHGPSECADSEGSESVTLSAPCPRVHCSKRCQFGFESDEYGCPTCVCTDPWQGLYGESTYSQCFNLY